MSAVSDSTRQACYLCGHAASCFDAGGIQFWKCGHCGLIMRREPGMDEASQQTTYDAEYYGNPERYPQWERSANLHALLDMRLSIIERHCPTRGTLLDIGCGLGDFLLTAQRAGWTIHGTEISAYARRIAEEHTGVHIDSDVPQPGNIEALDCITLWDVLEHDSDPLNLLAHIGQVTKPNGLLAVSMPNRLGLEARLRRRSWRYFRPEFGHITHHTVRSLSMLLQRGGFRVIEVRTEGSINLAGHVPAAVPSAAVRMVQRILDAIVSRIALGRTMTVIARNGDPPTIPWSSTAPPADHR